MARQQGGEGDPEEAALGSSGLEGLAGRPGRRLSARRQRPATPIRHLPRQHSFFGTSGAGHVVADGFAGE
jgi:hypothetical protein